GHSVPLPGLGTMRFGVRSKAVEKLEDVKANLITTRRIVFTPNVDVKDELKNTAIQITCLDEEGNVLKRVTSGDSGTVEDPEENENGESENSGSEQNGGSGSENSGSGSSTGSETESVMAPEISGTSPFTDSTQVTIQGPQGAEVRYTTDGSAPSAESTLYSEAITLSATTTIKAIAILNGETSEVTSKTFTKSGESGGFDLGN
ncbi:MAG: chitobiase/beta-hexosaminidase C-terminal domain-containing protein, partial [Prevotella sp.]|nr:chitobiase/beta-hexosaminidase C-terminal domain-containing protein [Prevotella sp.]